MRYCICIATVVLLTLFATPRLVGQLPQAFLEPRDDVLLLQPGGAIAPSRLIAWVRCLGQHQPGKLDEGWKVAETFGGSELAAVIAAIQRGTVPVAAADMPTLLRAGSILHTELASALIRDSQRPDVATTAAGGLHFSMAGRLVDELRKRVPKDPTVRAWFVTVGAILLSQREVATTAALLERGLRWYPADSQLLLFAGAAYELRASSRVQDGEDLDGIREGIGGATANLSRAEYFYRSAFNHDQSLIEAQIRLGRVLGLRGKHDDAVAELEAARRGLSAQASPSEVVLFFSSLFLGDELAALGRSDLARASYRNALALYPGADSAHLALGTLEYAVGARDQALAAIVDMAKQRSIAPDDPWRDYFSAGEARDVERLLAALGEMTRSRE